MSAIFFSFFDCTFFFLLVFFIWLIGASVVGVVTGRARLTILVFLFFFVINFFLLKESREEYVFNSNFFEVSIPMLNEFRRQVVSFVDKQDKFFWLRCFSDILL